MRSRCRFLVSLCLCALLAGCSGGLPSVQAPTPSDCASSAATQAASQESGQSKFDQARALFDSGSYYDCITILKEIPDFAGAQELLSKSYEAIPLAPVSKDGRGWQYIDGRGNVVLDPPGCQDAKPFRNGKAIVLKDGKYSFINKLGQDAGALGLDCVEIGNFSGGMACFSVKSDDQQYPLRYGVIDETGKIVAEPIFPLPVVYRGDFARVVFPTVLLDPKSDDKSLAGLGCFAKYYMDRQGQIFEVNFNGGNHYWSDISDIVPLKINSADELGNRVAYAKDGKFIWKSDKSFKLRQETFTIFKNALNEIVISQKFEQADVFTGGLAPVKEAGKQWGFIDASGNYAIQPQFDAAKRFSQGLAAVCAQGKWGYIDKSGAFVIKPQYEDALTFSEGLAAVCAGGKWGYINGKGAFVIKPQYSGAQAHWDGIAAAANDRGLAGLIDKKGSYILKPQFLSISYCAAGHLHGEHSSKGWGYYDIHGKKISSLSFEESACSEDGTRAYSFGDDKKNEIGYRNDSGVLIRPHRWLQATNFSRKGFAGVMNYSPANGVVAWGIIDRKGNYAVKPSLTLDEMLMRVFGYDTKGTDKELDQLSFSAAAGEELPQLSGSLATVDCRKLLVYIFAGKKLPPLADTPAGLGEAAEGNILFEENGLYGFKNALDGAVAVPAIYQKASYFGH